VKTVERGAALLDERKPGWDRKIDLDTLNLADGCNCVLGQVYGDRLARDDYNGYDRGQRLLGLNARHSQHYGFLAWSDWGNLTAAWRQLIEKRRAT